MGDTATPTGTTNPTPADIAKAKADEGANGATSTEVNSETRLPDDHPLVTALARQKAENDALKEKARRFDELEESQKTEAEKLAERLAEAKTEADAIPAKVSTALKSHLVKIHEISDEDADLFLTATDPEVLLKQAERFTARSKSQSGFVPTQGTADPSGSQVSSYELGRERAKARYQKQ